MLGGRGGGRPTLAPGSDVVRGGGGSLQFNLSVGVDKTRAELATAIERADSYIYIYIILYRWIHSANGRIAGPWGRGGFIKKKVFEHNENEKNKYGHVF